MNVKEACGNDRGKCGISLDGSWQRRGHVSHNGVVTAISLQTKKCSDVEILSDKRKACIKWKKKEVIQSMKSGELIINAGSTILAVPIAWKRSSSTRGLVYMDMLGDFSTHNSIVESKAYGDDSIPRKLECIGHVQKRVGNRLRKLKNSKKGVKLSNGKGPAGKGRLTDGKIDILQNYYALLFEGTQMMPRRWQ